MQWAFCSLHASRSGTCISSNQSIKFNQNVPSVNSLVRSLVNRIRLPGDWDPLGMGRGWKKRLSFRAKSACLRQFGDSLLQQKRTFPN
jgi:hypothetical protein